METPLSKIVTRERWKTAQENERLFHTLSIGDGIKHYGRGYKDYLFKYLDIPYNDMGGVNVLEIGSADFPAIFFCRNLGASTVIEPMESQILDELSKLHQFTVIKQPAEECEFPYVNETWLFNVLTHVIDPDIIIEKAKERSDVIKFFEPINTGISIDHPWSFDFDYYKERFGGCVQYYPPNDKIEGFHAHEAAFGVFYKSNKNI